MAFQYRCLLTFLLLIIAPLGPRAGAAAELTSYPLEIAPTCRGGRAKIYDECGDQLVLFQTALAEANRQGKVLLVSYGAEWCIWCHVFYDYVSGIHGTFTHTYSDPDDKVRDTATLFERAEKDVSEEAAALAEFAAQNFVLVHLDTRYASGADAAIASTGYEPLSIWGLPFVFTVTAQGVFAMAMDESQVETRRDFFFDWFRGYDRPRLQRMLAEMHAAAMAN